MCWLIEDYSMSRGCFPEAACTWQPCLGDQLDFKRGHKLHRLLSKPGSKPIAVSWVQPQSLDQVCLLLFSLPPKDLCPAHLYSQACRMSVTLPTPQSPSPCEGLQNHAAVPPSSPGSKNSLSRRRTRGFPSHTNSSFLSRQCARSLPRLPASEDVS